MQLREPEGKGQRLAELAALPQCKPEEEASTPRGSGDPVATVKLQVSLSCQAGRVDRAGGHRGLTLPLWLLLVEVSQEEAETTERVEQLEHLSLQLCADAGAIGE